MGALRWKACTLRHGHAMRAGISVSTRSLRDEESNLESRAEKIGDC